MKLNHSWYVYAAFALGSQLMLSPSYGDVLIPSWPALETSLEGIKDVPITFDAMMRSPLFKQIMSNKCALVPGYALTHPTTSAWPSGKPRWSGTSGASGTGATKTIIFNTISASPIDYQTVIAECGNTVSANVVLFDLIPTFTAVDNFPGRSTTEFGPNEAVDLRCIIDPSIPSENIGPIVWQIEKRGGDLIDNEDGTGVYILSDSPGPFSLSVSQPVPTTSPATQPVQRTLAKQGDGPVQAHEGATSEPADLNARLNNDLASIEALRGKGDAGQWKELLKSIDDRWSTVPGDSHALLVSKACYGLVSRGSSELRDLANDSAMKVLEGREKISIPVELDLAAVLRVPALPPASAEARAEWSESRTKRAIHWFEAWKHLESARDPAFDFSHPSALNAEPPAGAMVSVGGAPEAVRDPILRAQYEALIAANNKRLSEYSYQYSLRLLSQKYEPVLKGKIVRAYSIPDYNPDELKGFCENYIAAKSDRQEIISKVADGIKHRSPATLPAGH